jgi:hypothetical protein
MTTVTDPAPPRLVRPRWRAALCAWTLVLGALGLVGCPAKEVLIRITDQGIGYLIRSCTTPCASGCCDAAAGAVPSQADQVQLQLVLVTAGGGDSSGPATVRARSSCMQLRLGCDFTGGTGSGAALADCLAVQLNDLITQGIPDGLGFDGLGDLSEVAVILSFHSVPASAVSPERQCLASDLFACAGLTERFDQSYDITCASCTGGPPQNDPTSSNAVAPCIGKCFVENCQQLLAQGG